MLDNHKDEGIYFGDIPEMFDMIKQLEYRGYTGTVNFCDIDNIYHGKVTGLQKTYISYHGKDMECLKKDFMEAIDFYLLPDVDEADSFILSHAENMTG